MNIKFILSIGYGLCWFFFSLYFALIWGREISDELPVIYVWWVIIGIALLPGFLMNTMFFSNLLNQKMKHYPNTDEDITLLLCDHNEEVNIKETIQSILNQKYLGHIRVIVVDNASTDKTKEMVCSMRKDVPCQCTLEYTFCKELGKSKALNHGLRFVNTNYFLTVDADTCLEKHAVQNIMNHIVYKKSACVAANLFVKNTNDSFISKIQTYDYLLSIASVKRFQGSYHSTLVAQGAFSAYKTAVVKSMNGWKDVMGEDIVLTYEILNKKLASTYEPSAVGYTKVPATFDGLYNQRKRWAIGMIEGLSFIPPWKQTGFYPKFFTTINLSVIYLDLAFLFGFIPGVILAFLGYYFFVGFLTLFTIIFCILLYATMYLYQKKLHIEFQNSISGFVGFLLFFQFIQSISSLHGYCIRLFHRKEQWK